MCDEVMANIIDNSDMNSIGALATVLNRKVKEIYDIKCRRCGSKFISKLGPTRRLRSEMLKKDKYLWPRCLRMEIDELEIKVLTISYGMAREEAEFVRSVFRYT